MISYFLNWMGPFNPCWIETYGTQWSAGRIDIDDGSVFGDEMSVPTMLSEDWLKFGNWLNAVETEGTETLAELVKMYEATGEKITWLLT